jgi:hypothetical protein
LHKKQTSQYHPSSSFLQAFCEQKPRRTAFLVAEERGAFVTLVAVRAPRPHAVLLGTTLTLLLAQFLTMHGVPSPTTSVFLSHELGILALFLPPRTVLRIQPVTIPGTMPLALQHGCLGVGLFPRFFCGTNALPILYDIRLSP